MGILERRKKRIVITPITTELTWPDDPTGRSDHPDHQRGQRAGRSGAGCQSTRRPARSLARNPGPAAHPAEVSAGRSGGGHNFWHVPLFSLSIPHILMGMLAGVIVALVTVYLFYRKIKLEKSYRFYL